ncbi:CehA/McbA family metallohydrolase [Desulfonatronovibrio hydrogenovorans]|uniref:CehA/McbA family metallohydrolase n=1 Tax=Desulfonatronovibrio hydrogenovorans TaxID=53245 RepID=UPI00048BE181|nr:CehA/McbA family metallohydrolase [Desulfonatronovibrio hydrogenovorans]
MKNLLLFFCSLILLATSVSGQAFASPQGVEVKTGPTDIVNGIALHEEDLTVSNEFYKISFAIGTTPPWGVPHGSIVDSAIFVDGQWTDNRTALIDFLPHSWSAWPSTYQEVNVLESTADTAVIEVRRDYDQGIDLVTTYTVESGSRTLQVSTSMTNNSDKTYEDLLAGYSLCTLSGYMFGPWGTTERGYGQKAEEWFGDYVLGYDENFTLALHYPGVTDFAWGTGWRDLYQNQTLKPGDHVVLDAWIQFEDMGSTAQVVESNLAIKGEPYGRVSGTVKSVDGNLIDSPVVIFERPTPEGKDLLYAWTVGRKGAYEINLPPGEYQVHAVAKGYSLTSKQKAQVRLDQGMELNFNDIEKGGNVNLKVTEKDSQEPVDARIEVTQGPEILVEYVGARTFFTELDNPGKANFVVAPGDYELTVSHGQGFISKGETLKVSVEPSGTHDLSQELEIILDLPASGWYSSDLHHHSDILDGVTPPEYMVRSQLASGLDIIFVSDHDSIANNLKIKKLAQSRDVPSISGIEVSPNWGHINVLPIPLGGQDVFIDPSAKVSEIFAKARELDALIMIAHPYITYGYFHSLDQGMAPGGWDPDFDLIEINGAIADRDNYKALQRTWDFWTNNERYYLAGGSDVHDVWLYPSGNIRTIARVNGQFSLEKFYESLKKGRSYASYGPIIYPEYDFGSTVQLSSDTFDFRFEALSVNGLKKAFVVSSGSSINEDGEIEGAVYKQDLDGAGQKIVSAALTPENDTWYALVVEDKQGNLAMTNPVWVRTP